MSLSFGFSFSIEELADQYARSRKDRFRPVSMAAALRAIRILVPDCPWTDRELADLVAAKAIQYGHAVEFDVSLADNADDEMRV